MKLEGLGLVNSTTSSGIDILEKNIQVWCKTFKGDQFQFQAKKNAEQNLMSAIEELDKSTDPKSVDLLLKLLEDCRAGSDLYGKAVSTLVKKGDSIIPRLAKYLDYHLRSMNVQFTIPFILAEIGGEKAIEMLLSEATSARSTQPGRDSLPYRAIIFNLLRQITKRN